MKVCRAYDFWTMVSSFEQMVEDAGSQSSTIWTMYQLGDSRKIALELTM